MPDRKDGTAKTCSLSQVKHAGGRTEALYTLYFPRVEECKHDYMHI